MRKALLTAVALAAVLVASSLLPAASQVASAEPPAPDVVAPAAEPTDGGLAAPASANPSELTVRCRLPLVSNNYCPPASRRESPFSVQIAALHMVTAAAGQGVQEMSAAEQRAYLDAVFPTLVQALKESGAGGTRLYLQWSEMEPVAPVGGVPQYDWGWWGWYDSKLSLIASADVNVIGTVGEWPAWLSSNQCGPLSSEGAAYFNRFLRDLVARYKQPPYNVHRWEVLNEPDNTSTNAATHGGACFGNKGDGAKYAELLKSAYATIKAVDPNATVLMGGIAYDYFARTQDDPRGAVDGLFNRYFVDEVMAAGGGAAFDALSLHYYPDFHLEWERWVAGSKERINGWLPAPTCGDVYDGVGTQYEPTGFDLIAKATHLVRRVSTCYGVNKPVWVTEIGEHGTADPASEAKQARYVLPAFSRSLAAGAKNVTWFALITPPYDPYNQGLLRADLSPKPAYFAYQTMTRELTGFTYGGSASVPGVEAYVFNYCNQQKVAAWRVTAANTSGALDFPQTTSLRVVDRNGIAQVISDGGAGDVDGQANHSIRLQLTEDPVIAQIMAR